MDGKRSAIEKAQKIKRKWRIGGCTILLLVVDRVAFVSSGGVTTSEWQHYWWNVMNRHVPISSSLVVNQLYERRLLWFRPGGRSSAVANKDPCSNAVPYTNRPRSWLRPWIPHFGWLSPENRAGSMRSPVPWWGSKNRIEPSSWELLVWEAVRHGQKWRHRHFWQFFANKVGEGSIQEEVANMSETEDALSRDANVMHRSAAQNVLQWGLLSPLLIPRPFPRASTSRADVRWHRPLFHYGRWRRLAIFRRGSSDEDSVRSPWECRRIGGVRLRRRGRLRCCQILVIAGELSRRCTSALGRCRSDPSFGALGNWLTALLVGWNHLTAAAMVATVSAHATVFPVSHEAANTQMGSSDWRVRILPHRRRTTRSSCL